MTSSQVKYPFRVTHFVYSFRVVTHFVYSRRLRVRRRELTAPALRRSRGDEQQSGLDYHQNTDPTVDAIDQCLVSTAHLSECNLLAIRACTSEPTVSRDHTHSEGGMTNAQQMKLQFCPRYASRALPSCRLIPLHFAMICIRTLRTCRLIPLQTNT